MFFDSEFDFSGIIVYKTYEDFLNDKGELYDDYKGCSHFAGKFRLNLSRDGETTEVQCMKIWGFILKEELFRCTETGNFARLISENNIFYYENGIAHLGMLNSGKDTGNFSIGFFAYFSNDLNSEMFPYLRRKLKRLMKKLPEHRSLFECILDENKGKAFQSESDYQRIRVCVSSYQ